MTSRGIGGIKRAWFGSIADRVVRHASMPVLVARPTDGPHVEPIAPIRRLVVPLDGSLLAEEALPLARILAAHLGVPILLVRAGQVTPMIPPVDEAALAMSEATEAMREDAEAYLAGIQQHLQADGFEASFVSAWGTAFEVINAQTHPTDLVVLTSHGRGGVGRWFLGGVADKLIRECKAPVLVIPSRKAG